ncbi:MAG: PDZ domain-containing protein [Pirellulales bacterium]|nr:PDZ domain-containing protein [Pirellulales bacterium]
MSKSVWIGGLALLCSATVVTAQEPQEESGTVQATARVEMQVDSTGQPQKTVRMQLHSDDGVFLFDPKTGAELRAQAGEFTPTLVKLGDYWVGLQCNPADATLRVQLSLPEDQGLVVKEVMPESPAAAAGLKPHDVLLKAGETELKQLQNLIDAVESAGEKELQLEIIRGGKPQQVTVTPGKRPEQVRVEGSGSVDPKGGPEQIQKLLERMQPGGMTKGPFRLRFFHPGTILPPGAKLQPPLPGNMSVNITKQGDKPAKIVVERGDERWELTEDDLGKLPDDVRPHIERMLGRIPAGPMDRLPGFDFIPDLDGLRKQRLRIEKRLLPKQDAPVKESPKVQIKKSPEDQMQQQMQQMNEQIEQLRKMIDELRKE